MKILAAAAALIAAGCASAPGVQHPQMEVTPPAAWSAGPAGPAAPASAAAWWRPLADARAAALVDLGLEHNYDLAAAAARVEGALAQARMAGAPRWPQVQVGADVGRSKRNFVGFPIGGGAGGVPSSTTTAYGASLSSTWEADLWGRLRDGQQAALAEAGAAAADLEGARLSLTAQILRTYFGAVEAGRQLALADSAVAAYRLSEQQIGERYARVWRGPTAPRRSRCGRRGRGPWTSSAASWSYWWGGTRRARWRWVPSCPRHSPRCPWGCRPSWWPDGPTWPPRSGGWLRPGPGQARRARPCTRA